MYDITVIGPAVIDVLAEPFDSKTFENGGCDLDEIRMAFGGDALNEAVVLTRLGKNVQLISKVGADRAGEQILEYLTKNGVSTEYVKVEEGLGTAINIALVAADGSRRFLMNPHSSLRKLGPKDVLPLVEEMAPIVSFASIFISPLFTIDAMRHLFSEIKKSGRVLAADVTRPKNKETFEDLRTLFPYMDIFVPNDEEICRLTGNDDPRRNVQSLLDAGVKNAIVKIGSKGCLVGMRPSEPGESGDVSPDSASSQTPARGPESGDVSPDSASGLTPAPGLSQEKRPQTHAQTHNIVHVPAVSGVHCIDTTGAGDTFAAGLLAGFCDGRTMPDCARLGCAAASCSIETIGATDGVRSLQQVMERYDRI